MVLEHPIQWFLQSGDSDAYQIASLIPIFLKYILQLPPLLVNRVFIQDVGDVNENKYMEAFTNYRKFGLGQISLSVTQ